MKLVMSTYESRKAVKVFIDGLSTEKIWDVDIKLHIERRNTEQNAKFHALISEIADHIEGVSPVALKQVVKEMFFFVPLEFDGKTHKIHRETHRASIQEMGDLITEIEAWASSELGILLKEYRVFE